MNTNLDIGKTINKIRKDKKITLKELSEQTGLSTGYLSQFERGMTSIAIESLQSISKALEVDMDRFFLKPRAKSKDESPIIRSYDREIGKIGPKIIQYYLVKDADQAKFLPRIYEILPKNDDTHAKTYVHEGVEFIYIIEGILTLSYKNQIYEMYPEDSAYISSEVPHNWENNTSKKVKMLAINYPNPFEIKEEDKK